MAANSTGFNMGNFTFNGEQLSSIEQVQMGMRIVPVGDGAWCTKMTGVVSKKELGFYTPTGDNVRKMTACSDTTDYLPTPTLQTLNPVLWRSRAKICLPDIQNTVQVFAARQSVPASSIENSQVARILMNMMVEDIRLATIRMAWMNDSAGTVGQGGSSDAWKMNDGLWSVAKLFKTSIYGDNVHVTCTQNTTSITTQTMTGDQAYGYMCSLVLPSVPGTNAATILNQPDAVILCTRALWNPLQQYYMSKTADRGYMIMENTQQGGLTMKFAGVPVIAMDAWDDFIARYQYVAATTDPNGYRKLPIKKGDEPDVNPVAPSATDAYYFRPYRAIFTAKKNIILGVNNDACFDTIKGAYDIVSDAVVMSASGFLDCQIAEPSKVRILY